LTGQVVEVAMPAQMAIQVLQLVRSSD